MRLRSWEDANSDLRSEVADYIERRWSDFIRVEVTASGDSNPPTAVFRHRRSGLSFVLVPGLAAASEAGEAQAPVIRPFLMASQEVSQRDWSTVMGFNPSFFQDEGLPVESVAWSDVAEYCLRTKLQLPTALEWEYACAIEHRLGQASGKASTNLVNMADRALRDRILKGIPQPLVLAEVDSYASDDDGSAFTASVSSGPPDALGLKGMVGNVWEWTIDRPVESSSLSRLRYSVARVAVGGSWATSPKAVVANARITLAADTKSPNLGFRPMFRLW